MIFIIIAVYNRAEHTIRCIEQLKEQSYREFKIVVVNDGSTDNTKELLTTLHSEVTVLEGNGTEEQNNVVLTNAAFALKIVDQTKTFEVAFEEAKSSLFGLKAKQTLEKLVSI